MKINRTPILFTRVPITADLLPETGNPRYTRKTLKECLRCGAIFVPRSPRAQYCGDCQKVHESEKALQWYYSHGRRQTSAHNWKRVDGKIVYVPSGYNQSGRDNNAYKNGTGVDWYAKAIEHGLPEKCNRCGKDEKTLKVETGSSIRCLLLHHKDGNHNNNAPNNWEILCKKCHQDHHSVRGADGRFVSAKV